MEYIRGNGTVLKSGSGMRNCGVTALSVIEEKVMKAIEGEE